ncbi:hypothetical protein LPC13_15575 [Clostridium celatum]|uniref:hypothetical protein n=1 Tax=Clostridium celatum TaxID=36834 RepID=UPI001F402E3D|nr:hypothetical protein [Clostridium celatum]MCE9656685.1 hypothetical protein [Clostridium celatum]
MINNLEEKQFIEKRINKLENILFDLKERLLPEREEQYKAMASIYVRKIIELREEIEEYIGMNEVLIEKSDINIHVNGPAIGYGKAPISIISSYLDNFKTSVRKNYGILNNRSKVPKDIALLTDFTLNQLAAGSINISLSIPNEQTAFLDDMPFNKSLRIYFELLQSVSMREEDIHIDGIDDEYIGKLLNNILKILPDDKNIRSIEVYGNRVFNKSKICLDHKSRRFVLNKIESINEKEKNISINGIIREIDLDKMRFYLREIDCEGREQIKCLVSNDEIENLGEYLNSRVKVIGILENNLVKVKYIEKYN